nr:hypothetical protein [Tanacetum cinerariifolium]
TTLTTNSPTETKHPPKALPPHNQDQQKSFSIIKDACIKKIKSMIWKGKRGVGAAQIMDKKWGIQNTHEMVYQVIKTYNNALLNKAFYQTIL